MDLKTAFWRGKSVFLTGHTGFKGGWLSLWLQQMGANVTGYALEPSTQPNLFSIAKVALGMRSIIGDIRDAAALTRAMRATNPDIVIHMAAQPLVRASYADPVATYSTNVMGTVFLLEAVRQTETVRAVVNVTTDKCYENREQRAGYRETDALGGFDPYSSSKACAELVTASYRNSYFGTDTSHARAVALASARAGNVIGGGDWADGRLVPDILAAFERDQPVSIRSPQATRPWQHVLEPLRGYLNLAERLHDDGAAFAEAWNFGPLDENTRSVAYIVESLAQRWGNGASWHADMTQHPHEAGQLSLDSTKAASRLGWRPVLQLDDALSLVVDWRVAHRSGSDMRKFTESQINAYQRRVVAQKFA